MRVLKLLAWSLMGYVIYELIRGMTEAPGSERSRDGASRGRRSGDLERALNEGAGRMNLTGSGRGTTVSVEDSDGGSTTRVVGRGVISES